MKKYSSEIIVNGEAIIHHVVSADDWVKVQYQIRLDHPGVTSIHLIECSKLDPICRPDTMHRD